MTIRGHLRLLALATAVWAAFWIAGWPAYYQQYPTASIVAFEVALLVPVAVAGWIALRRPRSASRPRRAAVLAAYFTVPLFLYDWAWCGVHLGHGLGFLRSYWYLTAYYAVPWVLLPATALWLDRRERPRTAPAR